LESALPPDLKKLSAADEYVNDAAVPHSLSLCRFESKIGQVALEVSCAARSLPVTCRWQDREPA
jgi:hypothetical protein